MWPETALAHWCFDVYPEAIAADSAGGVVRTLLPTARAMMSRAYRRCDAIVDLGPRMRERLEEYPSTAVRDTLVPWALTEINAAPRPPDPAIRSEMFGDAELALLYSGTLGRAHDFDGFVGLARAARARFGDRFRFAFATRGNRSEELRRCLRADDTNLRVIAFGDEADLAGRLEAADVHLLSLRKEWSGIVVPSKFFGSLAVGRPALYDGPADSDIARWIRELRVGWHLDPDDFGPLLGELAAFAASPSLRASTWERARSAYATHFDREIIIDRWDGLLRKLIDPRHGHSRGRSAAPRRASAEAS
jgi:glycosyltransferase involved in cell wall biosynthesis